MPYFKWVGINIAGTTKKGKHAAYSPQELSERLFKSGIALLRCRSVYTPSFFWKSNAQVKGNLFKHKAKLLRAGILLPQSLIIVAEQSHNPFLYDMFFNLSKDIEHGVPFAVALQKQPLLSDPIVMIMLTAGHESGNLINAIENVALYFHKQYAFNKSIRSALAMPFLTLLFFIGISGFIFVFIIPRFADMFNSVHQDLPALTQYMINVSDFIRGSSMIFVLGFVAAGIVAAYYYCTTVGKQWWDRLLMRFPFIGLLVWQHQICQVFQALSLLINSGVTLVAGLKIVSDSVDNNKIKAQLISLHDEVSAGQLLSNAMAAASFFLPEAVALVHVGEESGTLGQSLEAVSMVYSDMLEQSLRRFVFFLQPAVIVVLGFLVTTLIFAVYLPIMQLSHAI
jgi:type IV pilus assembly protein PilC